MPNSNIFTLQTNDFDELATAFGGQNLVVEQLSPGTFEGNLVQIQLDNIQCCQIGLNQKIQLLGEMPSDTVSLWIPLTTNYRSIWKGFDCRETQIILDLNCKIDYTHLEGEFIICIIANRESLLQQISVYNSEYLRDSPLNYGVLTLDSNKLLMLRNYLKEVFSLASLNPDLLSQIYLKQLIIKSLLSSVIELIISSKSLPGMTARSLSRTLKFMQAVEYIQEHLDQLLTIQTISSKVGVGQRSLIYHFKYFFGMGPMEYCKCKRLNAVRRSLKAANVENIKISETARRWGFYHMGHFSANYKTMFGELPSETLQRERITFYGEKTK